MALFKPNFDDIRIIFCVQGYTLDYQFILREIGFWCRETSGSIPFNYKINRNQIDVKNQKIIHYLEDEFHGIKLKKLFENGLVMSDFKAAFRTLYHMAGSKYPQAKFIGICRDENINGLLHRSGLGKYVVDIDSLLIMTSSQLKCPSNDDLRELIKSDPNLYKICDMHDNLKYNISPLCAKVKAQYIGDYCIKNKKIQEVNIM